MNKIIRLLFCCLILVGFLAKPYAQSTPLSSGGDASGSGGTASYSLGEVAYTSINSTGGFVIQGVQQAYTPAELPINLLEFTAVVTDKKQVSLNWITVYEHNNQSFEVERSQNGIDFEKVVSFASKGNSSSAQDYSALDATPFTGISYYRLKQTDIDGKVTYSKGVSVDITATGSQLKAYPNPTTSILNLQINGATSKQLTYSIYSVDGKLVNKQTINNDLTIISTSALANGTYILQVKDKSTLIKSFKIIKK